VYCKKGGIAPSRGLTVGAVLYVDVRLNTSQFHRDLTIGTFTVLCTGGGTLGTPVIGFHQRVTDRGHHSSIGRLDIDTFSELLSIGNA
jgi:hypothetical protein